MHDLLRMHDDGKLIGRYREEVIGLDQLQALVHERRRIDGDLAPHGEVWMAGGLLWSCSSHLVRAPRAERPARAREHNALDELRVGVGDRLVHGRVFRVDGQKFGAGVLDRRHEDGAG